MSTWSSRHLRKPSPEEQLLYNHLLHWSNLESPNRLIERFRTLFIDGVGYPDPNIPATLDKIAQSRIADQEFRFILNRCCHILINRWQTRSQLQSSIAELIRVFEESPSRPISDFARRKAVRRLQDLVQTFLDSEQYLTLRRLAQVLGDPNDDPSNSGNRPLGTLIRRYPSLYQHCLISEDSSIEHYQSIQNIQAQVQQQFELDLSQYVTYQVRRSRMQRTPRENAESRILTPVKNPTLLSDPELAQAVKHYIGKVENGGTYQDAAKRFLHHTSQPLSYRAFKDDLYQYITASIDPGYGNRQFNNQLYAHLQNILPDSNSQTLNDFLHVRTCSQVLNFLVVDSPQRPQHFVFLDLVNNMGAIQTMGLLLKIVLACRKVKPYLEKRLSILFNHYEVCARGTVQWLIEVLENMNVAFSTNFGHVDLSYIRHVS